MGPERQKFSEDPKTGGTVPRTAHESTRLSLVHGLASKSTEFVFLDCVQLHDLDTPRHEPQVKNSPFACEWGLHSYDEFGWWECLLCCSVVLHRLLMHVLMQQEGAH